MPRILLLHASVGTGHQRAAEALGKALELRQPGQVQVEDALDYTPVSFRAAYRRLFLSVTGRAPSVWHYFYTRSDDDRHMSDMLSLVHRLLGRVNSQDLKRLVGLVQPEVIICTHFLPMEVLMELKRRALLRQPIYCVITDYAAHSFWVDDDIDGYFVGSELVHDQLVERGVPSSRIHVTGIPVDPAIAEPKDRATERQRLGLPEQDCVITLFGGGVSTASVRKMIKGLLESGSSGTLVVVAGRSRGLLAGLSDLRPGKTMDLRLLGYIDYVDSLVAASDLVITKAGGLIISEVLARGVPLVVVEPIPGHEEWNADFVVNSGAGVQLRVAESTPTTVHRLMQHPHLLRQLRTSAAVAGRPQAARQIADYVLDHVVPGEATSTDRAAASPVRILFAISDTGGGFRSAALAISAALQELVGDAIACDTVDMLQVTGVPVVRRSSRLYEQLTTRWLTFHDTVYRLTDHVQLVDVVSRLVGLQAQPNILRTLRTVQPHLVVALHPLTYRLLDAARRLYQLPFRLVSVVTDLVSLHGAWVYPGLDLCMVPTDEGYELLRRRGMPAAVLMRTGFPVHPKFFHYSRSQAEARRDLGLAEDRFTVLVTGGGVGSGQMLELVLALEQAFPNRQLLVVTGRNQALYRELQIRRRSRATHIYGFVNNMEALMSASDVVITKAGPGTLMEALVMRRPVIVTRAVGAQEWGNIDFVLDHKLGRFCPTIERIVAAVEQLAEPDYYRATVAHLAETVPRDGASQIAHLLLEQLGSLAPSPAEHLAELSH